MVATEDGGELFVQNKVVDLRVGRLLPPAGGKELFLESGMH